MPDGPVVSVVSPIYNCGWAVPDLVAGITTHLSAANEPFEIILVDDSSPDDAWRQIAAECRRDPRVKGLRLSRNFGQHRAITAGLDQADGDFVVVMDGDLQDDPADIPALLARAREGFDVVYGVKDARRHGWGKNAAARGFLAAHGWLAGRRTNNRHGSFSLLSRRAVRAVRSVRDPHRHYLSALRWIGFPSAEATVHHRERHRGRSSYSLRRLIRHSIDLLVSESDRLLYVILALGLVMLVGSALSAAGIVIGYLRHGFRPGWASTIVVILFCTSAIMVALGCVGIYVGQIFDQVRPRPLYIEQEKINL